MKDPNLAFLNKFLDLYQMLIHHDGYGDMSVNVRLGQSNNREVVLQCGKEYRYRIGNPVAGRRPRRYQVVVAGGKWRAYPGPERRVGRDDRRGQTDRRQRQGIPRNFRLERRLRPERRAGRGRRSND